MSQENRTDDFSMTTASVGPVDIRGYPEARRNVVLVISNIGCAVYSGKRLNLIVTEHPLLGIICVEESGPAILTENNVEIKNKLHKLQSIYSTPKYLQYIPSTGFVSSKLFYLTYF